MLRKVLVALAWTVGGFAGLCVLLYLIAVAVNWRDADPSAAALRMTDLYHDRPAVVDEDNAFIYAMGFDAAPEGSPLEMGRKRVDWLQQSEAKEELDLATDPLGERPDLNVQRDPLIRAYLEACTPRGKGCRAAFEAARPKYDDWRSSEGWLLERYRTLTRRAAWREFVSTHAAAPLPSYGLVMDGQEFMLLHAMNLAANGDATGVRESLGEDLRLWREVLASSDLLISKMIATAALLRHFKQGAVIFRMLPPERVSEAMPAEWQNAITNAERSMQRCMTGELLITSNLIRETARDLTGTLVTDNSITGKVFASLGNPLFQPQDTINHYAEHYTRIVNLLEGVPFAEYEAATIHVTELTTLAMRDSFPPRSLYNIPGRMLIGLGPDFGPYARRVGDIEGVRLAALAAVRLHEARVAPAEIPAALASSPFRNPYNGEPFAWDSTDGAVIFRGLEAGDRGEHRIQ